MDFDIPSISAIVAAAGVLIGVVYYILEMRHQAKTKAIDVAQRLYLFWESREFLQSYAAVMDRDVKEYEDLGKESTSKWIDESAISGFFENVGFLLRKRLIDPDLAYSAFPTIFAWEKLKFWIEKVREKRHSKWFYKEFEYLYNEMKKREQRLQQEGVKYG